MRYVFCQNILLGLTFCKNHISLLSISLRSFGVKFDSFVDGNLFSFVTAQVLIGKLDTF